MYKLIRPLLFAQDPEKVHNQMLALGEFMGATGLAALLNPIFHFDDPILHTTVFGINFKNPVSNAAGFDKNARLTGFLPHLNFGFVEIGSVTAQSRNGNPKPRLFRLDQDDALINRMGLNNIGADAMAEKLRGLKFSVPAGINIAKTHDPAILGDKAIEDFCYSFKKLYGFGDYMALNISCPNTAEGKTFEEAEPLRQLLAALKPIRDSFPERRPVLVKVSPDISEAGLDAAMALGEEFGMDGYIIANVSSARANVKTPQIELDRIGKGGLSGEPIRQRTTDLIRYAYRHLQRPCIIGLGGIDSAEDAYEKIRAGASLVQIFNGIIYQGPGLAKKINQGLVELLKRDGFKNLAEAVGSGARGLPS